MTHVSDLLNSLNQLIDNALGSSESATTRARLHALSAIIGALGDDIAPLLAHKMDVEALLEAIQRIEHGANDIETGLHDVIHALNAPAHNPPA